MIRIITAVVATVALASLAAVGPSFAAVVQGEARPSRSSRAPR